LGAVLQVLAGWWAVYSHILLEKADPWWNLALLALYAAIAITIIGILRGLRYSPKQPAFSLSPIQFVNVAGLKLAGLGCLIEIIAGVWIEVVHRASLNEPGITSALALLTVGMLTVNLGMVIGLVIEHGMNRHGLVIVSAARQRAVALFVLLSFSAIWLAASGYFIYLAKTLRPFPANWLVAVLLAFMATFVLVPVKKVMPRLGSGVAIGLTFNAMTYSRLVIYAGSPLYTPWGLLPITLFDLISYALGPMIVFKRTMIISSLIAGMFFWATYYPFTTYLFPWSFTFQLPVFAVVLGSVAGALMGNRVYTNLSLVVLGDVGAGV
jgi:hypothetical protein